MASWTNPWCHRLAANTARKHSAVDGLIPMQAVSLAVQIFSFRITVVVKIWFKKEPNRQVEENGR